MLPAVWLNWEEMIMLPAASMTLFPTHICFPPQILLQPSNIKEEHWDIDGRGNHSTTAVNDLKLIFSPLCLTLKLEWPDVLKFSVQLLIMALKLNSTCPIKPICNTFSVSHTVIILDSMLWWRPETSNQDQKGQKAICLWSVYWGYEWEVGYFSPFGKQHSHMRKLESDLVLLVPN